jgi:ABC-type amino acid transport substrate-binding protein
MDAKKYKDLMSNIETGKKAVKQLEGQIRNMETVFSGTIDGLKGEDKQKVQNLQAMVNRAIKKAENGGDYNEVIDKIKETFKTDLKR